MLKPRARRERLKRLGVRTLGGRTATILTLAAALRTTILAELLAISETSASKFHRLAGGESNRCAGGGIS